MWKKFLNNQLYREEGTESFHIIPHNISLIVNLRLTLNEQFCQDYVPSRGSVGSRTEGEGGSKGSGNRLQTLKARLVEPDARLLH